MAFLFKSKKGSSNALPTASRDMKSSEGPAGSSQIPTLNGLHQQQQQSANSSKPNSPTPNQQSAMGNIINVAEKIPMRSPPDVEKSGYLNREREGEESSDGRRGDGRVQPSPEQKSLVGRDRSADTVCDSQPPTAYSVFYNAALQMGQVQKTDCNGREQQEANQSLLQQQNRMTLQQQPRQPAHEASPYPWSQRKLAFTVSHTNPFPRYGAAVNSAASKDGAVYLMGGLINGSTVKGDLWMVETGPPGSQGSMSCYPVATTSEGPGPRVGHASLLVGNAFIVFGGDTKMDEGDMLDDTLYLLNTCKWTPMSVALEPRKLY